MTTAQLRDVLADSRCGRPNATQAEAELQAVPVGLVRAGRRDHLAGYRGQTVEGGTGEARPEGALRTAGVRMPR